MTTTASDFAAPAVLLENRLAGGSASLFTRPSRIIRADRPQDIARALGDMDAALAEGFHLAGWLSYELGYALEKRLAPAMPLGLREPLLWFGCFHEPVRIEASALDDFFACNCPPEPLADLTFGWDAQAHAARVRRALDLIRAGDVYQINLTFPVHFRTSGGALSLYAMMRAAQPAGHGGFVAADDLSLLSVSPELFIETRDRLAITRPMKGTAPRQPKPDEDHRAAQALQADPKQRAENLMIVDLLRNDLARISEIGSVTVPDLFTVETYPTLHTMTSTVTSRVKPGLPVSEMIRALFPCGSVTGAPKIRAMEIIRDLEDTPRGAYTGAIGMIAPDGAMNFNVAIRTATVFPDGRGVYGVGSGIVADSQPGAEYEECRLKARFLTELAHDFGLIETLRWTKQQGFVRLDLHLDRLASSARQLGFKFDEIGLRNQLTRLALTLAPFEQRRIRIELRRDGAMALAAAETGPTPECPARIIVASRRADAGDPFLRHKTTRRDLYDAAFAEAELQGCDDALLLNRSGFLTETARANIFVEADDGSLLTPALRHGLLPGILRRTLIDEGRAREADLRLEDIAAAPRWFIGNSLRNLREAVLVTPDDTVHNDEPALRALAS